MRVLRWIWQAIKDNARHGAEMDVRLYGKHRKGWF